MLWGHSTIRETVVLRIVGVYISKEKQGANHKGHVKGVDIMDLMTLAAKITLDDSSYTKGIKNAESMGQQLAGKMSAMTVAVGNLTADVVKKSVQAISGVVSGAVDGYADYQQLIGGVETLFKTSADKVKLYAEQSYKATGLSANQYMETVTSFSASLLQGLGGDTEQAADMANLAIQDMADNANKMGTDIGSIQAAYQGFAKQNYTMLDNLKLGYGGTAGEMVRLINDSKILDHEIENMDGITFDELVRAIHVVQTEMGITGTTAQEAASTISGSRASLEASWADFLVSIGGEADQQKLNAASERFKEAFETYVVDNLAPTIKTTIENAPSLISAVADAITDLPSKGISDLAASGIDLLTSTVDAAKDIGGWLIDGLVNIFKDINADQSKIADLGNAVGEFIGSALADIVTNAPTIVTGLFSAGVTLAGSLIEGLFSGLFGADEGVYGIIGDANDALNDSIIEAETNSTKASGIISYLEDLIKQYGEAAFTTKEWKDAISALDEVLPGAKETMDWYAGSLESGVKQLKSMNEETKKLAIEQAKEQALQTKKQGYTDAMAQLLSAKSQILVSEAEANGARANMIDFIRSSGQADFTGTGLSDEQLQHSAYAALGEMFKNGAGDIGYSEAAANLEAWTNTMNTSQGTADELKASLSGLEEQVRIAETEYLQALQEFVPLYCY